jgi:hypothetical protein
MPPLLPYRPGLPVQPGYRIDYRANSGLVAAGVTLWVLSYLAGLGFGVANDFDEGTGWTAVPVAGPWIAIGSRTVNCDARDITNGKNNAGELDSDCADEALQEVEAIAFLTLDGVLQGVGATLLVIGVTSRTPELIRQDVGGVQLGVRRFGPASFGLGASGTF